MPVLPRRLFLGALSVGAASSALPVAAAPAQLPRAHQKALDAIPEDPAPGKLAADFNFVASNEKHLERFRDAKVAPGGIHVGVGTEQNYVLAGWFRPEVLVLMDFDARVVDVHHLYARVFAEAKDPASFIALLSSSRQSELRALVDRTSDKATAQRLRYLIEHGGSGIETRLRWLVRRFRKLSIPCFLTDRDQYRFVREVVRARRTRALRGDLTGSATMVGIHAFARTVKLPVRTLYVSNAEEYFPYSPSCRRNFLDLPVDDHSVILRTAYAGGEDFLYLAQRAADFHAWLRRDDVAFVRDMLLRTPFLREGRGKLYVVPGPPT